MPSTFTDTAGRVWAVTINTETVKRVRSLLGVDLMEFIDGTLMAKLMSDVILLVDVLFSVCKPEADARGVSDVQFGEAMDGDVIQAGEEALAEALFRISHPSRREAARKAWEKAKKLREKAQSMACVRLEDPNLDRQLEAILSKPMEPSPLQLPMPGNSSGNLPASPVSIPIR